MTLQQQINQSLENDQPLDLRFGTYTIDEPLVIAPVSGSQQRLNIRADNAKIVWAGPTNTSMVYAKGWKNSIVRGLHLDTGNIEGVTAWDLDTPDDAPSISGLQFVNCQVNFGSGGGCIGWRGSVNGNLYGDVSALLFQNCMIRGLSRDNGDICWQALRRNNLAWTWHAGGAVNVATVFSNRNPAGGSQHGGGSMSFYGLAVTGGLLDYDFYAGGMNLVSGGRYEVGRRFMQIGSNGASFGASVKIEAVNIASYAPDDGIVFFLGTAATLLLDSCSINRFGGTDYDAALITANASASGYGAIRLVGGGIQADNWRTLQSGQWDVSASGVSRWSSSSGSIGWVS